MLNFFFLFIETILALETWIKLILWQNYIKISKCLLKHFYVHLKYLAVFSKWKPNQHDAFAATSVKICFAKQRHRVWISWTWYTYVRVIVQYSTRVNVDTRAGRSSRFWSLPRFLRQQKWGVKWLRPGSASAPDFGHLLQSFFLTSNWVCGLTRWAVREGKRICVTRNSFAFYFRLNRPGQRAW